MPKLTNYQKDLRRYRNLTHKYLDGIWSVSCHKGKARNNMYSWLAIQMGMTRDEAHVSKFDIAKCRKAISILKPKYIQLFGHDLFIKQEVKDSDMYYTQKTFRTENNNFVITIYCKNKLLNDDCIVENIDVTQKTLIEILSEKDLTKVLPFNPTLENIAKWIYDKIITAYKVKVEQIDNYIAIYEETEE